MHTHTQATVQYNTLLATIRSDTDTLMTHAMVAFDSLPPQLAPVLERLGRSEMPQQWTLRTTTESITLQDGFEGGFIAPCLRGITKGHNNLFIAQQLH